jgi:hypothetical protein
MWNYAFFGGKKAFASLCQLPVGSKFPTLPWASIVPAHFSQIWKEFLANLQAEKSKTTRRDELVDQLIPIFHNPNILLPMRILTVQEVRKLSGLENILTTERHSTAILTDKVVRDFCGNSFHPGLIDAALGSDEQFKEWVDGSNDAQPCHKTAPPIKETHEKYQQLLRLVLSQGATRGIQLKADRVDFEAKWQSYHLNAQAKATNPPEVQQPTIFSFLNSTNDKHETEHPHHRRTGAPFGDKVFADLLTLMHMEWLIQSSATYENVPLSSRMLQLALSKGVGARIEDRTVKNKYGELLYEYTAAEKLEAIMQLVTVLQVATLGSTHQSPFGFLIWAPKLMQPPFLYVGALKPSLLFLLIAQETDQPFQFGTVAYDYLQTTDLLQGSDIPTFTADVIQFTNVAMVTFPVTVRVEDARQFLHMSEYAAILCPCCTLCFLSTLGARPCFIHAQGPTSSVVHVLGGLDGTGGMSLIGLITTAATSTVPDWIVIHVVDNAQVHVLTSNKEVSPFQVAIPIVWSPIWQAHQMSHRSTPRHIGRNLVLSNGIDPTGEYVIFSGTEEWSRILLSAGENPPG